VDENHEQEWSDPRSQEGGSDAMSEGGDAPDDVDVEKNLQEAREGKDDAPPL
jgi:hypothetical protein